MDDGEVVAVARRAETVALLVSVEVAGVHGFGTQVSDLHAADETSSGPHRLSHGRCVTARREARTLSCEARLGRVRGKGSVMLTLVSLFLNGARLQVQDAAGVLRFLRGELLSHFLDVVRVEEVEDTPRAEPVVLKYIHER